jgi:ElaB/YqjD/DUF883 family membrane-anchored ribosome-binding protein
MYGNNAGIAADTGVTGGTGTDQAALSVRHQETMDQLNRTVTQAEDLLRALGNESGEAVEAMRARVTTTLRDARSRLSGKASDARRVAGDTLSKADAYVHENPWRAVAIGAGIGVLLAMMMRRRGNGASDAPSNGY